MTHELVRCFFDHGKILERLFATIQTSHRIDSHASSKLPSVGELFGDLANPRDLTSHKHPDSTNASDPIRVGKRVIGERAGASNSQVPLRETVVGSKANHLADITAVNTFHIRLHIVIETEAMADGTRERIDVAVASDAIGSEVIL